MPTTTRKRPTARPAVAAPADLDDADLPEPTEFTVEFTRDDDPEPHTFAARPRFTYKRMREAARGQSVGGAEAVLRFEKMIRPALLDTDGTPAKWVCRPDGGQFEGPDGELHDMADLAELLKPENGSSRRRWAHLMDDDDDLEVDVEEIVKVYELLVGASTDRPTRRSRS